MLYVNRSIISYGTLWWVMLNDGSVKPREILMSITSTPNKDTAKSSHKLDSVLEGYSIFSYLWHKILNNK